MEITEGLISQYSSKLNNNEFLFGLGICCDICSLFVLTETLQALLCSALPGAGKLQINQQSCELSCYSRRNQNLLHDKFSETSHLVRLCHFLGVGKAVVSLELIQSYVLSFDVH